MTLKQWLENRWLQRHETSPEEINNLFQIVDRDLKDAMAGVSADWRFGIAYNNSYFDLTPSFYLTSEIA